MSTPTSTTTAGALPVPARNRWQPLRAGLVDLFYYDREEFWFRDGRLLLRGNNGTGKSKVLALMLPFLLDADLSAHRVEPDADPKKRMEWNLLLGGAYDHSERLGYTWLEFGRVDDDGTAHYCTIGAGLKAVEGRGMLPPWFFVTTHRIGAGLELVDHSRTVLTKDRLSAALDGHGTRFDRAGEYRRAVDEALFGLGTQRYGALVDLLVQLRQPQLSKRPSEKALSAALTEALPPLDPALLTVAAESFRSLQEDREDLDGLRESRTATERFVADYRAYARVAARRQAAEPLAAQNRSHRLEQQLLDAQTRFIDADGQAEGARDRIAEAGDRIATLRTQDAALRDSTAMDAARELDAARETAREREADADRIAGEAREAERTRDRLADRATTANNALAGAQQRLHGARGRASERAQAAGLADSAHEDGEAQRRVDAQLRALDRVRALADGASHAERTLADARRRLDDVASRADAAESRIDGALRAVVDEAEAFTDSVRRHLDATRELRVEDPAALFAELRDWCDSPTGRGPVTAHLDAAAARTRERLTARRAALSAELSGLRARRAELEHRLVSAESGEDAVPPVPYTRRRSPAAAGTGTAGAGPAGDDGGAADTAGAPLWRVTDFAPHVSDSERAGIEAALEASGILDARIASDGAVTHPSSGELVLDPDDAAAGPHSLTTALTPAADPEDAAAVAVPPEAVAAVLGGIGLGPDSGRACWVATDGAFRNGVLTGAWSKPGAQYIGRGAREQARRARLQRLTAEIAEIDEQSAGLGDKDSHVARRLEALSSERSAAPSDEAVRSARHAVVALQNELRRLHEERDAAADVVEEAAAAHGAAAEELHQDSADAGLPAQPAELGRIRDALGDYRVALADLWPAAAAAVSAEQAYAQARDDLGRSEDARTAATGRMDDAQASAERARVRYQTLRESVSSDVDQLHEQLDDVQRLIAAEEQHRHDARRDEREALEARGKADGRRQELAVEDEAARAALAAAAEVFRRFAASGLLHLALDGRSGADDTVSTAHPVDRSVDATVEYARSVEQALTEVDAGESAWKRTRQRVTDEHKALEDVLVRQGDSSSMRLVDDAVIVVDVTFRGRPVPVAELDVMLAGEVADHERLLTAREREILENHLLGEISTTMQELISGAEAQVARMNDELATRPTSTGMRLRLDWQPREDGPAGLAEARRMLRRSMDGWSEDDREAVGGFLQQRIHEVRARDTGGTWLENLGEALDYRTWFRFVIERHQNGKWRPATGPASGGESALVVSVPLFAAASAHYSSAGNPHAPRLVMLDEAFAGVDDNARAKYLGLLASFDMDVVMTSEREWGCYAEVPGIAIAQLARTDGVEAVLVTRWEWDGARRLHAPVPVRADAAAPPPPGQDGLWE
ncbi:TIGR02680 family protein [Tomitella fengzijianii]|uniref:TIGR02680 family protein n=1 Tax=Tomitella fengzijianii TaxID=2597660 RepID=UPI00131B8E61|nr:TIGR02680 family protein [Tomitella fengzijianii]